MLCQFQVLSDSVIYIYTFFSGGGGVGGLPWWLRCLRNPWTEKAWWAMVMRSQRAGHDQATNIFTHHFHTYSFFTFCSLIDYYKIPSIVPLRYTVGPCWLSALYIKVCIF